MRKKVFVSGMNDFEKIKEMLEKANIQFSIHKTALSDEESQAISHMITIRKVCGSVVYLEFTLDGLLFDIGLSVR